MSDQHPPRQTRFNPAVGTVEHPDEMIHLVRNEGGELVDVGIDEFVEIERMTNKYIKITLTGKDETKPVVLILESEEKITIREHGIK